MICLVSLGLISTGIIKGKESDGMCLEQCSQKLCSIQVNKANSHKIKYFPTQEPKAIKSEVKCYNN